MGYYTRYELSWSGSGPVYDRFLAEGADEEFSDYGITPNGLANNHYDTMKWYSWEEDMKAFSTKYPTVLFEMVGEGEEAGDLWAAYIRNGKSVTVKAKITYEKPDLDEVLPLPEGPDEAELENRRAEIRNQICQLEAELKKI